MLRHAGTSGFCIVDHASSTTDSNRFGRCATVRPLLAGASLGALDLDEWSEVDRHLMTCAACRREYDQFAGVVDDLGFAAPDVAPPNSLRDAVLGSLTPQPIVLRMPDWRWVSAAAAVIVILLAGNVALLLRDRTSAVTQPTTISQSVAAASAPQFVWFDLTANSQPSNPAYGILCAQKQGSVAWLMVQDLPMLPNGKIYQAWLAFGDQRVNAGTFVVDERGRGFLTIHLAHPIASYTSLGITQEPSGGSPVPTGTRLLSASL